MLEFQQRVKMTHLSIQRENKYTLNVGFALTIKGIHYSIIRSHPRKERKKKKTRINVLKKMQVN